VGGLNLAQGNGESFMHEVSNRNKRGLVLNIKTDRGRDLFNRLILKADVFLTNLRKSTKEKLGLDYPSISAFNPRIIHAAVSGYGPEGPLADLGAFDPLGLARSGMMFLTGGDMPRLMHLGVLDQATAIALSHAVLAALYAREKTGRGQEVHVSLLSTAIWLQYCNFMLAGRGIDPSQAGDRRRHSPLRNSFRCKDGRWIIGTHHPEDRYWSTFLDATGQSHLADDPRFRDEAGRIANNQDLVALFDQVFAAKTSDEWMALFIPRGLMFSPIQTTMETAMDPQTRLNQYVVPFDHPEYGPLEVPGYPAHFSGNGAGPRLPAPALGEHTDDILAELGCSAADIAELKNEGAAK
jgi:crotonobetainyl-CoA:carnitine CoA-transferase CaiB-like acyl-CoA transferase